MTVRIERFVRRSVLATIGFAIASSAAAHTARAQLVVQRTVISLPGYAAPILLDTIGLVREVPGPADQAFAALTIVYRQLQIPTSITDTTRRYIGNLHFTKMRALGKSALSTIVDCGSDMSGPRADAYRVHLAIVSRVDSIGETTSRVRSTVVAGAEDVMGSAKTPIRCGSTGALESRITSLVTAHLKSR